MASQLVISFKPRWSEYSVRAVDQGFVVDKVARIKAGFSPRTSDFFSESPSHYCSILVPSSSVPGAGTIG